VNTTAEEVIYSDIESDDRPIDRCLAITSYSRASVDDALPPAVRQLRTVNDDVR